MIRSMSLCVPPIFDDNGLPLHPFSTCFMDGMAIARSSKGALNTDWEQEGGAKERLKVAADSFRLEGLVVGGVRLGGA